MRFADIFKSSFLQEYSPNMSTSSALFFLCLAACFGFYIFLVYRVIMKHSFYQKTFNMSLWGLAVIIAAIIIAISSNIVLSLGMVGALSIVRYRTAVKDPLDLVFLFWSISEGILCGAGMGLMATALALLMTLGILVLNRLPLVRRRKLLTLSASDHDCEEKILELLDRYCQSYAVKSRSLSSAGLNLVVEFESEQERQCTAALMALPGVHSVTAMTCDGDVSR